MSNRQDKEREADLQPKRIDFAVHVLVKAGMNITYEDKTRLEFYHKDEKVTFFPYSGWHTGKTIKDGRGLQKLLNQLK